MAILFLALYMGLILVRPMDWWAPLKGLPLLDFVASATLIAASPRLLHQRLVLWHIPPVRWGLLFLAGAGMASVLAGANPVTTVSVLGKQIILLLLIVLLGRDERYFRWLVTVLILSATWMALNGILQAYTGRGFTGKKPLTWQLGEDETVTRVVGFGIFADPNELCLVFVIAIPLAYVFARSARHILSRGLFAALIPLLVGGAWLTNSRGGMMGILAAFSSYVFFCLRSRFRFLLFVAGVAVILAFAPARFSSKTHVDIGRVQSWEFGLRSFLAHPLGGTGFSTFSDLSPDDLDAHNAYIKILTEMGLLGYLPWFLLIFLTFLGILRALPLAATLDRSEHFYTAGTFTALVGYLAAAYFITSSYNPVLYIVLALAIARSSTVAARVQPGWPALPPFPHEMRWGLAACLASIPLLAIVTLLARQMASP